MLLGRFYSSISLKGRVALPSKFRKETGNHIVIARWYENCLVIVGTSQWLDLISRIAKPDAVVTRPIRSVERFIYSTAFEIESDNQGRFVIPPSLRETANLKDRVVFLGMGDRIELWDQSIWEKEEVKVKSESDEMLEKISRERKQ